MEIFGWYLISLRPRSPNCIAALVRGGTSANVSRNLLNREWPSEEIGEPTPHGAGARGHPRIGASFPRPLAGDVVDENYADGPDKGPTPVVAVTDHIVGKSPGNGTNLLTANDTRRREK